VTWPDTAEPSWVARENRAVTESGRTGRLNVMRSGVQRSSSFSCSGGEMLTMAGADAVVNRQPGPGLREGSSCKKTCAKAAEYDVPGARGWVGLKTRVWS
jgi:hypothetical protein